MKSERNEWKIGLSAWIIQDGNYPDFVAKQQAEFALEFFSPDFVLSESKIKSAVWTSGAKYKINSQVVYLAPKVWVLDFGISAFQDSSPPDGLCVGNFVSAEIYLGIDAFSYFERLNRLPGIPPLVYSWDVNSINQLTAPFIETQEPSGRKILIRDETKLGYKAVPATDAWSDDDGHAEYILDCQLLNVSPKFESVTAI